MKYEGVTQEPTGVWRARVMVNGKRRSQSGFPTARAARDWRTRQISDHNAGTWIDPRDARTTVEDYRKQWLQARSARVRAKSIEVYTHVLGHLPEPQARLGGLTQGDVERWQSQVAQQVGIPTANKMVSVLRMMLKDAVRDRLMPTNVAEGIPALEQREPERPFLTPAELDLTLSRMEGPWRDAAMFLAFTGMRAGDGLRVTSQHVDQINAQVRFDNSKSRVASGHWIPLAPPIRQMVLDLARDRERFLYWGHFLFSVTPGHPLDLSNFNKKLKAAASVTGKDISSHALRRTCASYLIRSGHNPVQVAKWLGHTDPAITLRKYAQFFADDWSQMGDSLGQMWDGRDGPPVRRVL